MTEAPNTSIIEKYLEELEDCQKEAQRTLDKKNANVKKAKADYARAFSNLNKFKLYWDKIESTKIKGDVVIAAYQATQSSIESLREKLNTEMEALAYLNQQAIACANTMEMYSNCLEELNQKIDRLSNSKIDKNNAVIKALKDLHAAYEEALACAHTVFKELLMVLEKSYILQDQLGGVAESDLITTCGEDENGDPLYELPTPDVDDEEAGTHAPIYTGLEDCIVASFATFCEAFPLFEVKEGTDCALDYTFPYDPENADPNCSCSSSERFIRITYNKLNAAISASNAASNELATAVQEKNQAQATKEAIDKSLEAANAAKSC